MKYLYVFLLFTFHNMAQADSNCKNITVGTYHDDMSFSALLAGQNWMDCAESVLNVHLPSETPWDIQVSPVCLDKETSEFFCYEEVVPGEISQQVLCSKERSKRPKKFDCPTSGDSSASYFCFMSKKVCKKE